LAPRDACGARLAGRYCAEMKGFAAWKPAFPYRLKIELVAVP
jgi:hypothetical protein